MVWRMLYGSNSAQKELSLQWPGETIEFRGTGIVDEALPTLDGGQWQGN